MSKDKSPVAPRLALIAGPTASGKSAIALDLAAALGRQGQAAWIINADSMQVYRDLPILSAAPSEAEMGAVPHRLYGAWDGARACSAADWATRAKAEIAAAHAAGALPVLVGGTGMYLKVLLEGIAPIPAINPEVRALVRELPVEAAYAALMIEDPERATALEPGDTQRIARALEVKRSTGTTLADWQLAKSGGIADEVDLTARVILPERQWVYDRCDARFAAMVKGGAIEEVEALLTRNLDPALPVMRAIGVPEIIAFLQRTISQEELIDRGAQATRNYAKRQFTWFRNQTPEEWTVIETGPESQNVDIEASFVRLFQN
jgi:tRNA dimethylallyltransferase